LAFVVIGCIVGAAWLLPRVHFGSRNQGRDTLCTDYLKMSHADQAEVIDDIGYSKRYTTREKQLREARSVCRHGGREKDLTLQYALGP